MNFNNSQKYSRDLSNYYNPKKIKTGGFSTVYSIQEKNTDIIFACKVIKSSNQDEQARKMINREIGIMIRLQHPTIIKFHGFSLTDFKGRNNSTIIMSYAEKGSLSEYLQKVQRGLSDSFYDNTCRQIILIGIARGMQYLHSHHIIHRDLKPDNVLLDDQLNPHISDFGISKIIETNKTVSQTENIGTAIYMAPEMIRGDKYSGKVDVYSFGILMYEVVTDTNPFPEFSEGKISPYQLSKKISEENYRPSFTTPVKKGIRELIEKCWSNNPDERPTFEEIFNRLAYNVENSVYDLFDSEKNGQFYLDDIDIDRVLLYADEVSPDKVDDQELAIMQMQAKLKELETENRQLKERVSVLEQIVGEETQQETIQKPQQTFSASQKPQQNSYANYGQHQVFSASQKPHQNSSANYGHQQNSSSDQSQQQNSSGSHSQQLDRNPNSMVYNFPLSPNGGSNGIIYYLVSQTGGNIHDIGIVHIFSNGILDNSDKHHPKNLVNRDSTYYCSVDDKLCYVCFDFKDMEVQVTDYIITTCNNPKDGPHLRTWVVETSNDGVNFEIIDSQKNVEKMNSPGATPSFTINKVNNGFANFVRIRQTSNSYFSQGKHNYFALSRIEFFGNLRIPSI